MQYTDFVTLFNLYCFNYFIKTLIIIGCINFVLNLLLVRSVCLLVDFFATTCSKVLFVVKKVNFQQVEIFLFEYSIRVIYFVGILHQAEILLEYSFRWRYFVSILNNVEMFSCGIYYIMCICYIQWNVNLKSNLANFGEQ